MWLPTVVTVAPLSEPLTTAEAKAQCRVDLSTEDDLIDSYVAASRAHIEQITGTALLTQTRVMRAGDWCDLERALPAGPVQSITSVQYVDQNGVTQTLSTSVYISHLQGIYPRIELAYGQSWPAIRCQNGAITITAVCGYGDDGADLPNNVFHALRLVVSGMYENRGDLPEATQRAALSLCGNDRRLF